MSELEISGMLSVWRQGYSQNEPVQHVMGTHKSTSGLKTTHTSSTTVVYLFYFAVLHGSPGVNPGGYGRYAALLLSHMGFKPRFE